MEENMKREWSLSLILALILAGMICSAGVEYGRTIYDGKLSDSGHSWAGNTEQCEGDDFILAFDINNLTGGVQANLNLNAPNRYAIGFVNMENGSLATYLYREEKENFEHIPGITIDYDPLLIYHVEISKHKGDVQVSIRGGTDGEALEAIDYHDADPLPPGAIDFETLEKSSVRLSDVIVNCNLPVEEEEEPPSMGVGYFKPPN